MQNTPHSWAVHTLQCFPPVLSEFFQQNSVPKENKQQIKVKKVFPPFRNSLILVQLTPSSLLCSLDRNSYLNSELLQNNKIK